MKECCRTYLNEQFGGDADVINEIYGEYVSSMRVKLMEAETALAGAAWMPLDRVAHTIKGNALASGGEWYGIGGKLPLAPDVDSPVWLVADGTVYEASPVGETPDSFAAYLPQKPETMYVCWRTGGSLFTAPVMLP